MNIIRDFIDYHRSKMGLTREEYSAYYLSEKSTKNFEQFLINEDDRSRSEGFVPATLKREFEKIAAGTEINADALDYAQAAKDDLVVCYVESSDDMIRVPKYLIELEDGEGI